MAYYATSDIIKRVLDSSTEVAVAMEQPHVSDADITSTEIKISLDDLFDCIAVLCDNKDVGLIPSLVVPTLDKLHLVVAAAPHDAGILSYGTINPRALAGVCP